jgi:hypothetical protein
VLRPEEPFTPDKGRPWPRAALLATLALGIAARMAQYLGNRSLWLDEAYLALNILSRDFSGLLRPLDHHQIAPPLFLWAVKLAISFWGDSERHVQHYFTATKPAKSKGGLPYWRFSHTHTVWARILRNHLASKVHPLRTRSDCTLKRSTS